MKTMFLAGPGPWHSGGPWHDGGPWQHGDGPGWWPVIPLGFALFWLLVLGGGGYLLWRRTKTPSRAASVLAERYARGEIDEEEYRERLSVLRS